ncbi:hypothetical protein FRC01_014688 [Tulasnella sp. 417]|nr:hypothetical protein FRC01_014688 [Tulasnella sp. 417]
MIKFNDLSDIFDFASYYQEDEPVLNSTQPPSPASTPPLLLPDYPESPLTTISDPAEPSSPSLTEEEDAHYNNIIYHAVDSPVLPTTGQDHIAEIDPNPFQPKRLRLRLPSSAQAPTIPVNGVQRASTRSILLAMDPGEDPARARPQPPPGEETASFRFLRTCIPTRRASPSVRSNRTLRSTGSVDLEGRIRLVFRTIDGKDSSARRLLGVQVQQQNKQARAALEDCVPVQPGSPPKSRPLRALRGDVLEAR